MAHFPELTAQPSREEINNEIRRLLNSPEQNNPYYEEARP